MTTLGIAQILFFFALILAITKPVGAFMSRLFEGERTFLHPILRAFGTADLLSSAAVKEDVEQRWTQYAASLLCVQHVQLSVHLPDSAAAGHAAAEPAGLQPGGAGERTAMTPDLAFNTAVSFTTNTNWQSYVPANHAELLRADGGADGAELRLGRGRHRGRDRAGPRICAAGTEEPSATSGWM